MKKVHYVSGLVITIFIGLHLVNHTAAIFGPSVHIQLMNNLRLLYRNIFIESLLLAAVFVQIISGLTLLRRRRGPRSAFFDRLHSWTGLYLAFFLIVHITVILLGRLVLHLDTNFYFGIAGLNTFPLNLFFIPYYALAIFSFFGHIAAVHYKKMKKNIVGLTPRQQSIAILSMTVCWTVVIFYGLTNHFTGVEIPAEYGILIGE